MRSQVTLNQTPLYDDHIALKAKIIPFASWQMPLQYDGILVEYEYNRKAAGIFDTSHMGEFIVEGDCIESGLDCIVTQKIVDMPAKTCRYGTMLNEDGGIIDDLIIYRIAEAKWMIVVNAVNIEGKADHFMRHLAKGAIFNNISRDTGKIDVQGPLSKEVLSALVFDIKKLEYYAFDYFDLLDQNVIISRTGYTGELGYEIYFPGKHLPQLWQELLKNPKLNPSGLGVRDVLRLEMGYGLYGHDLDETISPLEAGLSRFVDFTKDFIGKEALSKQKKEGIRRKIICFTSESRRSPRSKYRIYTQQLQEIGVVTSGTFSPHLKRGVGMGYVLKDYGAMGEKILIGDQNSKIEASISQRPLYKGGSLRN